MENKPDDQGRQQVGRQHIRPHEAFVDVPPFKYFPDRSPLDEAPDPFECQYEQQSEDSRIESIECCVPLREEQDKIGENEYVDDPH
jgi:hypothetical protein